MEKAPLGLQDQFIATKRLHLNVPTSQYFFCFQQSLPMCDITQVGSLGSSPSYWKSNNSCGLCVASAVQVQPGTLLKFILTLYLFFSNTESFWCCSEAQTLLAVKNPILHGSENRIQRNVALNFCAFPFLSRSVCPLAKLLHC